VPSKRGQRRGLTARTSAAAPADGPILNRGVPGNLEADGPIPNRGVPGNLEADGPILNRGVPGNLEADGPYP
jgi:hypothetical protein